LFDFTQGWLYVFTIGVLGGMVREKNPLAQQAQPIELKCPEISRGKELAARGRA
jgi:hypothetical protein